MSVQEFVFVCDSSECFLGGARVNVKSHSLLGQKKKKNTMDVEQLKLWTVCIYASFPLIFPLLKTI